MSLIVPFSVDPTSLGGLFAAPFDVFGVFGQSNLECRGTASTGTPVAGTFQYGKDNLIAALSSTYDRASTILDRVAAGTAAGVGGPMVPFANAIVAATGRPCVIVPSMLGGSGFPGELSLDQQWWTPNDPIGVRTRSGLFGSMIARNKAMVALGGTYRATICYRGEAAALGGSVAAAAYSVKEKSVHDAIAAEMGIDQLVIQVLMDGLSGGAPADIATVQAAQAAFAVAGHRLISPKTAVGGFEADGLHNNAARSIQLASQWASLIIGAGWI